MTNPFGPVGIAGTARDGYDVDENGNPYGTVENPFPIGAPIGYVIQSAASFGTGVPTKGFGEPDQFEAGYADYGANLRLKMLWNDHFEGLVGVQSVFVIAFGVGPLRASRRARSTRPERSASSVRRSTRTSARDRSKPSRRPAGHGAM